MVTPARAMRAGRGCGRTRRGALFFLALLGLACSQHDGDTAKTAATTPSDGSGGTDSVVGGPSPSETPVPPTCIFSAESPTFDEGTGECPLPLPPPFDLSCACCPPDPADEFGTRCCLPHGECGYDFGSGCTYEALRLPTDTAMEGPACSVARNVPGIVLENVPAPRLGAFGIVTWRPGDDLWSVLRMDPTSCSIEMLEVGSGPPDGTNVMIGPDALFLVQEIAAQTAYHPDVTVLPLDGSAAYGISVAEAAASHSPYSYYLSLVGVLGSSVFAIADFSRGSSERGAILLELPCCGGVPRVVGEVDLPWSTHSASLLGRSGDRLFLHFRASVLHYGPTTRVATLDLGTGTFRDLVTVTRDALAGLRGDTVVLAYDGRITALAPSDCTATVLADRGVARISALHVTPDAVYWSEEYDTMTASRIFRLDHGRAEPVRLVEISGRVLWLATHDDYVYWHEHGELSTYRILRIGRDGTAGAP
jgi:hypothetical protein